MLSRLRRSSCAVLMAAWAWAGSVQAAGIIRVTEAMSNALTLGDMDWWELTNYGDAAVDITGWKMDDNSLTFASAVALVPFSTTGGPAWSTIDPGESVVFIEATSGSTAVPQFQALWNLGSTPGAVRNPKLGTYTGSGVGLSSGGDAVIIFDSTGGEVSRVAFGAATTGRSFYWSYDSAGAIGSAPNAVSTAPLDLAYTVTATGATPRDNTGSPGIAVVAPTVVSLYWTAAGTTLGGNGTWNAVAPRWSPTESPVAPGPWADGKAAVFAGSPGTVTVASAVSPLSIIFSTSGFTLASGAGSISGGGVSVVTGGSATIAARLTGTGGLTVNGGTSTALNGGTLRLSGTAHDYTGFTSVVAGTLQLAGANAIPDASRLAVSRFATADFNGFSDTVGGLQGLGTVWMGPAVTVNITGTSDARLDGFLSGTGDLVIDSVGAGVQRLNTSRQTLNEDFAVKDYAGRTLVVRGGLGVDRTAVPIATTEISVEAAGRLLLSPSADAPDQIFTFGSNPALPVSLRGGLIGQGPGDDVELANRLDVSGTATVLIRNPTTPSAADPTTEQLTFSGPLTGPAGAVLKILASDTTSGLAQSRATFTSAGGNTFAGTVSPGPFAAARFNGDYPQTPVALDGGKVDGYGAIKSVTGSGIVSPAGTNGAGGILTVGTIDPTGGMSFTFDLDVSGVAPEWSNPAMSGNDVLRLTGTTPITASLVSANVVRLFVGGSATPVTIAEGTTFLGGFFTTSNQQAAITNATYATFVYGDGLGTDIEHGGRLYYTLANFNQKQGTALVPAVTMVSATAGFPDGTATGFVMQTMFGAVAPTPTTLGWYGDGTSSGGGGTWSTSGATWFDGSGVRSWEPDATAIFSGSGGLVALAPGVSANSGLRFTGSGYTLSGSALTLGGASNPVDVAGSVSATIAAPLAGSGGLAKTGLGTLVFDTANTYSGTTSVDAGTLLVTNSNALRASPIMVQTGGRLALPTATRLTVSATSLVVDQATGGVIDIGRGRIEIAPGGITESDLRADLVAGRAGGSFSGTGGIMTTGGVAGAATQAVVGYRILPSGAGVVAWAAFGDSNLDGQVNLTDVSLINNGGKFGQGSSTGATWSQGDYNYSGGVTLTDISLLNNAALYNAGLYLPPAGLEISGVVVASVPEPATWMLGLVGLAALAARWRRSRSGHIPTGRFFPRNAACTMSHASQIPHALPFRRPPLGCAS